MYGTQPDGARMPSGDRLLSPRVLGGVELAILLYVMVNARVKGDDKAN